MLDTVLAVIEEICEQKFGMGIDFDKVLEMDASYSAKVSRHVIVPIFHRCFKNVHEQMRYFMEEVCNLIRNRASDGDRLCKELLVNQAPGLPQTLFIDLGVYTKSRHLRCLLSRKLEGPSVPFVPTCRYFKDEDLTLQLIHSLGSNVSITSSPLPDVRRMQSSVLFAGENGNYISFRFRGTNFCFNVMREHSQNRGYRSPANSLPEHLVSEAVHVVRSLLEVPSAARTGYVPEPHAQEASPPDIEGASPELEASVTLAGLAQRPAHADNQHRSSFDDSAPASALPGSDHSPDSPQTPRTGLQPSPEVPSCHEDSDPAATELLPAWADTTPLPSSDDEDDVSKPSGNGGVGTTEILEDGQADPDPECGSQMGSYAETRMQTVGGAHGRTPQLLDRESQSDEQIVRAIEAESGVIEARDLLGI
ncbi:hypothetical protein KFL_006950080 [Klebsormidium nitens]|uniref:DNA-directed primase/polymerase protein n=1 Tax=Klebsormidium nitens TaxID=105231 RepID=A0A1Y1IJJ0_KLENI|nr:hypothetical protein KFL_006950080 [Klebsormidium nitens]|eukprot:GAQ90873.1 hypothetical protein KFL_006950080 [Klebsormidium nitens]